MKKAIIGSSFLLIICLILTGTFPSCTHDSVNLAQFDTVCFEREVLPVFVNGCATTRCHSAESQQGDYNLSTYDGIMRGITAGSPEKSKLYRLMTSASPLRMPPDYPISETNRILIRLWIAQGALPTVCPPEPRGGLR